MEKLFDETFTTEGDAFRTIWYGYFGSELDEELSNEILEIIKRDISEEREIKSTSTAWIFYNREQNDDAIGDKVRSSIMIRELNDEYKGVYNMSDYEFVTALDKIEEFIKDLLKRLN